MDLQDTFYIIGIVFMSLMLLITLGIVIAVFVIKRKIDAIHQRIEEKLAIFGKVASTASDIAQTAKKAVKRG